MGKLLKELQDLYVEGKCGALLLHLANARIDWSFDPEIQNLAKESAAILIKKQAGPTIAYLVTRNHKAGINACALLGEELVAGTLGMLVYTGSIRDNIAVLPIVKEQFSGSATFLQDASAAIGLAMDALITDQIEERIRQKAEGSFSLGDRTEFILNAFIEYPELLSQSAAPVSRYLEYNFCEGVSEEDILSLSDEEIEEDARIAYSIAQAVSRMDIRNRDTEPDTFLSIDFDAARQDLINDARNPSFLKVIETVPSLSDRVKAHCLTYYQDFPLSAKRFGYTPDDRTIEFRPG